MLHIGKYGEPGNTAVEYLVIAEVNQALGSKIVIEPKGTHFWKEFIAFWRLHLIQSVRKSIMISVEGKGC